MSRASKLFLPVGAYPIIGFRPILSSQLWLHECALPDDRPREILVQNEYDFHF